MQFIKFIKTIPVFIKKHLIPKNNFFYYRDKDYVNTLFALLIFIILKLP